MIFELVLAHQQFFVIKPHRLLHRSKRPLPLGRCSLPHLHHLGIQRETSFSMGQQIEKSAIVREAATSPQYYRTALVSEEGPENV
jgi:hypothetical protein